MISEYYGCILVYKFWFIAELNVPKYTTSAENSQVNMKLVAVKLWKMEEQ